MSSYNKEILAHYKEVEEKSNWWFMHNGWSDYKETWDNFYY